MNIFKRIIKTKKNTECKCGCCEHHSKRADQMLACKCCNKGEEATFEFNSEGQAQNSMVDTQAIGNLETTDSYKRDADKSAEEKQIFYCPLYNKYCAFNSPDECSVCKWGPSRHNSDDPNEMTEGEYEYYTRFER